MSAEKLVILTADQYRADLVEAARQGASMALAEFSQNGGAGSPVLSVNEAAKLLKVGAGTLRAYVSAGQIPHFHIGRVIKFRRADLMNWEPPAPADRLANDPAVLLHRRRAGRAATTSQT